MSYEIKREMPRRFQQSLRTKDDDKFYVKVLLGHLSRFYYAHKIIRVSPTTRNTPGRVVIFFACEKTLPNANDAYYGENTRCSGIYLACYYIDYDTNDNTYLHKAAQVGRCVKVVFDTY